MSTHTPNQREIVGGLWDGHLVRRARKEHGCNNARHCKGSGVIAAGSFYVEHECDPDHAGGFGMKKLCAACVDDEARAALSLAGQQGQKT